MNQELRIMDQIANVFSLGKLLKIQLIKSGMANHNYLVSTADNKEYVVRFLIEQKPESVDNDTAIHKQLSAVGLLSPEYLHYKDGKCLYYIGDYCVVVMKKLDGVVPEVVDKELCYEMGKVVAVFHNAVTRLPVSRRCWLNKATVETRLALMINNGLVSRARKAIDKSEDIFKRNLPQGVIHGDLTESNVLVDEHSKYHIVGVLDFEETEQNIFIVDIARTLIEVCRSDEGNDINRDLADSLIEGYDITKPLTNVERDNIPLAVFYMSGAGSLWFEENGYRKLARQYLNRGHYYYYSEI